MKHMQVTGVVMLLVLSGSVRAWGQTATMPSELPSPAQEKALLEIIEPTQGRPVMVQPGGNFHFMFCTQQPEVRQVVVSLVSSLSGQERVPLTMPVRPYPMQKTYWVMVLNVPALAKPGLYDVFINLGEHYQRIPRAVKVVSDYDSHFRFVHLSNMNVGSPSAPDFDGRLVDEINLLNPAFIIATGDFVESTVVHEEGNGWRRTKEFLERFNAPCYILCGDQEDPAVYQREVDPSPIGSFDYGPYHFVLMLDTQPHPIDQHRSNVEAVLENLKETRGVRMSFLVGRGEGLRIIDGLKRLGYDPADVFARYRVRLLICGGSTDWDYVEHAEKLTSNKLTGVDYVRTGQSSTSMKNGGSGVSHYRVFEVDGSQVSFAYPAEAPAPRAQHSIPVGQLRVFHHGPNDGSQSTERISIVNSLNQAFADCRVAFRITGDPSSVKLANCRESQILNGAGHLIVLADVDVPAKSAVHVAATTDTLTFSKLSKLPLEYGVTGSKEVTFRKNRNADGLVYFEATAPLELQVKNLSERRLEADLQVCLSGQTLLLREAASTQPSEAGTEPNGTTRRQVTLAPGGSGRVWVWPVLRHVAPGEQYLVVYCLNDPLQRMWVQKVTVTMAGE